MVFLFTYAAWDYSININGVCLTWNPCRNKAIFTNWVISTNENLLTIPLFIGSILISAFCLLLHHRFQYYGDFFNTRVSRKNIDLHGYMELLMGTAFFIGNMLDKRLINYKATRKLDSALTIMFIAIFLKCICSFIFAVNSYNIMTPRVLIILVWWNYLQAS